MAYGSVENRMSSAGMPIGAVIAYAGDIDSIPPGWHICDGTEGTPDLRGRFVLGQSDAYVYGSEGGEATHRLTVNEMPSHSHQLAIQSKTGNTGDLIAITRGAYRLDSLGMSSTGGSQPHNNMPPYYVLYYIMRIA